MKKYIVSLIIIFLSINGQAQDLQTGEEVDGFVMHTFEYGSPGTCHPSLSDVIVKLDSTLYPFASGIKIALLISTFSAPLNTVLVDEVGEVNVGDRLPFSEDQLTYTFRFLEEGSIDISVIISGTPLLYQENYFCEIQTFITDALCSNISFVIPVDKEPACSVSLGTNTTEDIAQQILRLYPNPLQANQDLILEVQDSNTKLEAINIYDIDGCLMAQTLNNSSKKLSLPYLKDFPKGTYIVQVNTSKGSITKKIIKL